MAIGATFTLAQAAGSRGAASASGRPQGPCDIYAAAGDPCVAAHSTTRALYAGYNGPLYQVIRQSDGKTLDIGVVQPSGADHGGYADATKQDAFCANTYCWISTIYDQSGTHNDLTQPPRGAFSGPAMGGFNNISVADMAPITIMGHKAYGVFIEPGMGMREDDPKSTAVDDQAEGQYWVVNGHHYNSGCCYDYGNAEIDSRDDDAGTMETTYFGNATSWYHGNPPGPWVMTDQENNLVGCVNSSPEKGKLCADLPNIKWRFVTAMAKGEPHHWTSMGGDSQQGQLQVMFNGPRVDGLYDPMRKQGAILLGNGGDNSVGSQGTFYEGAVTKGGTFPTDATDQQVQANVVEAKYAAPRLTLSAPGAAAKPTGLQTFTPGSSQEAMVTFTNTTGAPVSDVQVSLAAPKQWAVAAQSGGNSTTIAGPIAPGASASATFKVTSGAAAFNGDLVANARWAESGAKMSDSTAEKVRNVSPVKINEFRVSSGPPNNMSDSFIELYNAGSGAVDVSNWTLTEHATQEAVFSDVKLPAGTKIASHGFYVLGISNSGLAVAAKKGDTTIHVRSTAGMSSGDSISIDSGAGAETRTIATLGSAASPSTTLWQPLPDGPVITIPAGSTNVPVTSVAGFEVGQKIALGYGAKYPAVGLGREQYEVATVTAVGKAGTQALLAADAKQGETNIKVTNVSNISVGDKIRLDVASMGHGIETVTVTKVGTQSGRTALIGNAAAGATNIKVRTVNGLAVGDKLLLGTPAKRVTVTITSVGTAGPTGTGISFTPALQEEHINGESAVAPGTGLELAAPLKFNHSANLPFSDRGTGVTFQPATAFAHSSNEPVQALGTGITLDRALGSAHGIDAVVRDAKVTTAGYQGSPEPNQWFGGPELSGSAGSMILRDAAGLVVDSLNYGLMVDPWAAEGYQAESGAGHGGCRVTSPGTPAPRNGGFGRAVQINAINRSAGRYPDGADTDSNCDDFIVQPATTLAAPATPGSTNIKVASVADFAPGETVLIGSGAEQQSATIATVGTAGATTAENATAAGATVIPVASAFGFAPGSHVVIDSGANEETAVVASANMRQGASITVTAPLTHAHAAGVQVAGSGITLSAPLSAAHASGTSVAGALPTPGAPNKYERKAQ